jgi:hypothetical protein
MKLVSTKTLYGGPSAELCLKKSEEDVASLRTGGTRENARVDEKKEGGGGQESIFSVAKRSDWTNGRLAPTESTERGESGGKRVSSLSVRLSAHAYAHVFHFRRIVAFLLLLFAFVHARLLGIQDALDLGKLFRLGLVLAHAGGPGSANPPGRARADAGRSATATRATRVGAGKARGTSTSFDVSSGRTRRE